MHAVSLQDYWYKNFKKNETKMATTTKLFTDRCDILSLNICTKVNV